MPAKKMIPARKQNPPPPKALAVMQEHYDTSEVRPTVSQLEDGILLDLHAETEFVLMTPRGARRLAKMLNDNADAMERKA